MTNPTAVLVGPNRGKRDGVNPARYLHPVNVSTKVLCDPKRTLVFYNEVGESRLGNILGLSPTDNSGIANGEYLKTTSGDVLQIKGPTTFEKVTGPDPAHDASGIADWWDAVKTWAPPPKPDKYKLGPNVGKVKFVYLINAYMADLDGKKLAEQIVLVDENGLAVTARLGAWMQVECKDGRMVLDDDLIFSRKLEIPIHEKQALAWRQKNP